MDRGLLAPALILLAATALLAGCLDAGEPATESNVSPPPDAECGHPWPCQADAWPERLSSEATEHPRQPAELPDGLTIEDGTAANATPERVTYRWTDAFDTAGEASIDAVGSQVRETTFEVPAGLYTRLRAEVDWSGEDPIPPERDARLELRVLDEDGDAICRAYTGPGATVAAYVPADDPLVCESLRLRPLEERADWRIEVEARDDVDAIERFEANLTLALAEARPVFEQASVEEVRVASFDGTGLRGWILRPDVPEGVQVPVVFSATPYAGQTSPAPDDPGGREESRQVRGADHARLVSEGYAVAVFNVRGTGESGGCFTMFGPDEQRDVAHLVDWLGNRSWSNGRVGMTGLSYLGTTPWEAAIQSPDPLKTIVVAGMVSDLYTFYHTPQGAAFASGAVFQTYYDGLVTGPRINTPLAHGPAAWPGQLADWAPRVPERACPEVARTLTTLYQGTVSDERNPSFWNDRRLVDGFPDVTASVLLTHGFEDRWNSGHQQQELAAWKVLPEGTPKHQLEGQWEHQFPHSNSYRGDWTVDDWSQRMVSWLEFWLKGVGDPPESLGTVDYQDGTGTWHEDTAWPPARADEEALYLSGEQLAGQPGGEARAFRSVPDPVGSEAAYRSVDEGYPGPLCTRDDPAEAPHGLLYQSEPVDRNTLIAGNPLVHLNLTADQPGGLVTVALFDLGPGFRCEGAVPHDALPLTTGAADLRFHEGNLRGEEFPTDEPAGVRVDLTNLAEVLPTGHRLGLLVSYGDPSVRGSQPYTPNLTVHGDSELRVPVVDGTLGGEAPVGDVPARPFTPDET